MTTLKRTLSSLDIFGYSLAMTAPTLAMSFVVGLVVRASGVAAPLAFMIGLVGMVLVGLSFSSFGKELASAGSVYQYVRTSIGPSWGFIAGWALLLAYVTFAAGVSTVTSVFLSSFLSDLGVHASHLPLTLNVGSLLLACWLVCNDMRFVARVMVFFEFFSIGIILFLSIKIVHSQPLSTTPFHPDSLKGWSGIGYGLVFTTLAFAGFEGSATLGAEARNPKRMIPLAMMGSIVAAGLIFVFVSYAQLLGFGIDHIRLLADSPAPLSDLAGRFVSNRFAELILLSGSISAYASLVGLTASAARLLFSLAQVGAPWLHKVDGKRATPVRATLTVIALCLLGLLAWGGRLDAQSYSDRTFTIGTLSILLVYMGVTAAKMIEAFRTKRFLWVAVGVAGLLLLAWPLWNSLYPVPEWPGSIWPYVVLLWLVFGAALLWVRQPKLHTS